MEYFFRHNPDPQTNINMIGVWIFLFIYLLIIYMFRSNKNILKTQLILVVLVEIALILWYFQDKDLFLIEGLPLYHCRIAAFMLPIFYFTKQYKLASYFAYLGVIGPLVAYSIPDPSKFMWPHITNLTYVCAHSMLLGSSLMFLFTERKLLSVNTIIKVTFIMNAIITSINILCGANYGYLSELPENLGVNVISPVLFVVISLLIVITVNALQNLIGKISASRKKSIDKE